MSKVHYTFNVQETLIHGSCNYCPYSMPFKMLVNVSNIHKGDFLTGKIIVANFHHFF